MLNYRYHLLIEIKLKQYLSTVGNRFHLAEAKECSAPAHPGTSELLLITETTWI